MFIEFTSDYAKTEGLARHIIAIHTITKICFYDNEMVWIEIGDISHSVSLEQGNAIVKALESRGLLVDVNIPNEPYPYPPVGEPLREIVSGINEFINRKGRTD